VQLINGAVDCSNVELVFGSRGITGLLFRDVKVAPQSSITSAYIAFRSSEDLSDSSSLQIWAEASDDADSLCGLSSSAFSVLPRTSAVVQWSNLPTWEVRGKYKSVDITHIIEEIINRPGWDSGNNIALFISGSGTRSSFAYEEAPPLAPTLYITSEKQVSCTADVSAADYVEGGFCTFDCSQWDEHSECNNGACICSQGYDLVEGVCVSGSQELLQLEEETVMSSTSIQQVPLALLFISLLYIVFA